MKKSIKPLLILLPIILFIIISVLVSTGKTAELDTLVYENLVKHMTQVLTDIMKFFTNAGGWISVACICILLVIIPYSRKIFGIPVFNAVIISTTLNNILKSIFLRERPDILQLVTEESYSFPSGHAMTNMALYAIIILLTMKRVKNKAIRNIIIILSVILILLIGISRVYLGVHYITDVFAGWCLGFLIAIIVYWVWKKIIYKNEKTIEDIL